MRNTLKLLLCTMCYTVMINSCGYSMQGINDNDNNPTTTKNEQVIKNYLQKKQQRSGLNNVGATCYMNATLQCLANNPTVSSKILKYNRRGQLNPQDKQLSREYAKVLQNICFNTQSYSPNDFKGKISEMNPLFAGIQANDSKDFVQFMLETLHCELNKEQPVNKAQPVNNVNNIIDQTNDVATCKQFIQEFFNNNKSVISDQYYGVSKAISECTGCKIKKYNYQTYNFLIFPLKAVHEYVSQNNYHMTNKLNLYNCFDYDNNKIENFTGDNQMYCNHCNKLCDATYQTQIASLPNELVIVLSRGKANQDYNKPIIINDNINLSNYVTLPGQNCQYYLSGIVCHIGPSSMSGHFIAYTRNSQNGYWVKYNDGMVISANDPNNGYQVKQEIQKILSGTTDYTPYILFYTKVNQ